MGTAGQGNYRDKACEKKAFTRDVDPDVESEGRAVRSLLRPVEEQWLACAAAMAEAGAEAGRSLQGTQEGRTLLGRGAGGDHTLEIDRACEESILRVLDEEAPAPYSLVSEETGIRECVETPWRVILDPLDGSLNAKRGLEPFGASVGVADGACLGDVRIAHVRDYLRPHSFSAVRGVGLFQVCPGKPAVTQEVDQSRVRQEVVEMVLLEAGHPNRHPFHYCELSALGGAQSSPDLRVRQLGSLALSLCYVALGIADILVAAVHSRSVDIAAGLLVLEEAGGSAASLLGEDLKAQPLDLEKRCAFVAWRAGLDGEAICGRARALGPTLLGPG